MNEELPPEVAFGIAALINGEETLAKLMLRVESLMRGVDACRDALVDACERHGIDPFSLEGFSPPPSYGFSS